MTRDELIGTWRLLSIQLVGPNGRTFDPFFGAGPTGVLVYDPSGWMSVQIVGSHRQAMEAPASFVARASSGEPPQVTQQKAAGFDTYYAYFGTWHIDEATVTVVHDVKSSLIPGESGERYSQAVSLEDGHLIFRRPATADGATVQEKVWARVTGPERAP